MKANFRNVMYVEYARFEVFTAVKIQVQVFWVVMPCSVAVRYRCFGGPCCFHLGGEVKMSEARSRETFGIVQRHYTASQPRRPGLGMEYIIAIMKQPVDNPCHACAVASTCVYFAFMSIQTCGSHTERDASCCV